MDTTRQMHPVVRKVICTCYNCPRTLACLIFGNEHKPHHRIITGVSIIVLGTLLGNITCASTALHIFCDSTSRFVEAMGSVPIIEHLGKVANGIANHTTESLPQVGEVIVEPVAEETEEVML